MGGDDSASSKAPASGGGGALLNKIQMEDDEEKKRKGRSSVNMNESVSRRKARMRATSAPGDVNQNTGG
jgi:hypothetical protein